MNIIQQLVNNGQTEQALQVMRAAMPEIADRIALLSGQLTNSKMMWLSDLQDKKEHDQTVARINAALLDYAKSMPAQSNPAPIQKVEQPEMNKLQEVKSIFQKIKYDLENMNYSKTKIMGYISDLNTIFEANIFSAFSDTIYRSDWDTYTSAEQREACKKVLEAMSKQEERVVARMEDFQSKLNGTVSLDEAIQNFFNRPSMKSWSDLAPKLNDRFADASLFGEGVYRAFAEWQTKLNNLDDEISFAMDFNFDHRSDFGAFLKANLSPKNFNYE